MMELKTDFTLKPYQVEGAKFLLENNYAILGDEMGLGKSLQALVTASTIQQPTIIVCPGSLRYNWEKEIVKFFKEPNYRAIYSARDAEKVDFEEDFIITSYSLMEKSPFAFELCDYWVFDEAHFMKDPMGKRYKFVKGILEYSVRSRYVSFLTGTPIANRPDDFYTLLYLCSLNPNLKSLDVKKYFSNKLTFQEYFMNHKVVEFDKFSKKLKKTVKASKRQFTTFNREKIDKLKAIMVGKYLRRMAKDHLDLPPLQVKDIYMKKSINKELEEVYSLLKKNIKTARSMELKEKNAYQKFKYTVAYVVPLVEEVGQVLVFTDHVGSCTGLATKFRERGFRVGFIHGQISAKKRDDVVDKFIKGELDILVATIGTTSMGHTFVNCYNVVFNDFSYKHSNNNQAIKRIHRIGQERMAIVHRMLGDASDKRILELVEEKESDADFIYNALED